MGIIIAVWVWTYISTTGCVPFELAFNAWLQHAAVQLLSVYGHIMQVAAYMTIPGRPLPWWWPLIGTLPDYAARLLRGHVMHQAPYTQMCWENMSAHLPFHIRMQHGSMSFTW
jgi:hypothetical protein